MTDTPKTLAEMREAAARAVLAQHREADGTQETMIHNRAVTKCSMAVLEIRALPSDDEVEERVVEAMWPTCTAHSLEATNRGGARYAVTGDVVRDLARAAIAAMRGE